MTPSEITMCFILTSRNPVFCGYYLARNPLFNINNPKPMAEELGIPIEDLAFLFSMFTPGANSMDEYDADIDRIIRRSGADQLAFLNLMFAGMELAGDEALN